MTDTAQKPRAKVGNWNCILDFQTYADNGRTYLGLIDEADGEPIADCTINVPDEELAADEVAIKNYSENEGMLDALVTAGIISPPVRVVKFRYPTCYIEIPICKLLIKAEIGAAS